jgi:hypothetical protein
MNHSKCSKVSQRCADCGTELAVGDGRLVPTQKKICSLKTSKGRTTNSGIVPPPQCSKKAETATCWSPRKATLSSKAHDTAKSYYGQFPPQPSHGIILLDLTGKAQSWNFQGSWMLPGEPEKYQYHCSGARLGQDQQLWCPPPPAAKAAQEEDTRVAGPGTSPVPEQWYSVPSPAL